MIAEMHIEITKLIKTITGTARIGFRMLIVLIPWSASFCIIKA